MTTYLRTAIVIAPLLVIAACAATNPGVKPIGAVSASVAENPACLTQTGSRIPGRAESCAGYGRSYSSDDIQVTGSATADGALRLLDPAMTVHH